MSQRNCNIYLPHRELCHCLTFLGVLSLSVLKEIILLQTESEGELAICLEDWRLWAMRQRSQPWWDLLASYEQWNTLAKAAEKLAIVLLFSKNKRHVCVQFPAFLSIAIGLFGWPCSMSKRCSVALVFLFQMVLTGLLFNSGVWNLVCCYGNEVLQLQKSNAWDNCWCQVVTCLLFLSVFSSRHFI